MHWAWKHGHLRVKFYVKVSWRFSLQMSEVHHWWNVIDECVTSTLQAQSASSCR